jgi:hypothetical protein
MAAGLSTLAEQAAAILAELASVDLDDSPGSDLESTVLSMQRMRGHLDVAEARTLARWDAAGGWRASGARTAASWLARHLHLPLPLARQRLRHARALRAVPAVEAAWASGEIDRAHVTTLLSVRTRRTSAAFEAAHPHLVDVARTAPFHHFKAVCDRFELMADPDGAEQKADEGRAARELHLSQTFGGMWFGKLTLDPISGEIVATTLRMIEQELFESDWAAAKERLGRDPMVFELDRTPAQRRADALVEIATRARTVPAGGRRPAPLFTVVVGYETFVGPVLELFNRTVISPGTAATWLTDADIERVVFDTPSRVIDVGVQRRLFTGGTRRAVEVRDRECFHEGCNAPAERLEIDHIHEAAKGGRTTQANGRVACGFHNRWRNHHPDEPDDPDPPA